MSETPEPRPTLKETVQRHRQTGRGRSVTWIVLGLAALVALIWLAPGAAHRTGRFAERGAVFQGFASERAVLTARAAAVLGAEEVDAAEVEVLRREAKRLADEAIDEGLDALVEAAATLTPEQRAAMARRWSRR